MLDNIVKEYISKSVLCWLATVDESNVPNVSPKEMFAYKDDNTLLVAHIASPNSISNIKTNKNVCLSFVDIFVQKGFKIKGTANVIDKNDPNFIENLKILTDLFTDKFPIKAIIVITVNKIVPIQAPSYWLYPETTEEGQVASAMETYKVMPI